MAGLILFIVCIVMILTFAGFGLYSWRRKTPANFWAGEKIPDDAVSDVKKYNRANGLMWIIYGVLYLIPGVMALFDAASAGFILAAITFAGTPILIFIYVKIIRPKYVSNSDKLYG